MPESSIPIPAKPGQGVTVERLPVAKTRQQLRDGSFILSTGLSDEIYALRAQANQFGHDIDQESFRKVLFCDEAKTFRNSLASLTIEEAWPAYSEAVDGKNAGVYNIAIDEQGKTSLVPEPTEKFSDMPASSIARRIALSNQATLSHFICREFVGGKIPQVSGDLKMDTYYLHALNEQTSLLPYLDSEFRTLPLSVGPSAVSTASGTIALRTQVFGLPNLLDALAARDGFTLTNSQHRNGVDNTLRKGLPSYYLPITHVITPINREVVDGQTLELRPYKWRHNNDPDNLLAYPDPALVASVNQEVQLRKEAGEHIANQTNCPAFHSRVPKTPDNHATVPLPRSVVELALHQLDRWYYPYRTST